MLRDPTKDMLLLLLLLLIVGSLPISNRVCLVPQEIADVKYLTYKSPAGITKFHRVHDGWKPQTRYTLIFRDEVIKCHPLKFRTKKAINITLTTMILVA